MSLLRFKSWAILIKDANLDSKEYEIIQALKKHKCKVVGINREHANIDGIDIYESLNDVPYNIDVVVILDEYLEIYTMLEEMELLDIKNIWFEKGCKNENVLKKAREMKLNIEYKFSLIKELKK